jgi:hypothetical protein
MLKGKGGARSLYITGQLPLPLFFWRMLCTNILPMSILAISEKQRGEEEDFLLLFVLLLSYLTIQAVLS